MIGWVDASSGASGDMLLGALLGAGVPLEVLAGAVDAVAPERVVLRAETVTRSGFAATRCHVEVPDTSSHRTWRDVSALLADAPLDDRVRDRAHAVFERLAVAEAAVHGTSPEQVHFHEVGALDAVADVVGVCAGLAHLGLEELVVSPVAVGSGRVATAHGDLPVPPPAVVELLRGAPSYAGPGSTESCTPTGAALLTGCATTYGPQPAMCVVAVGVGAGGRDPDTHANVLRLLVGSPVDPNPPAEPSPLVEPVETPLVEPVETPLVEPVETPLVEPVETPAGTSLLLETNVDDLDPRLWPNVLAALLETGASDAWLSPIVMKKGRPAHTLHALVRADLAAAVRSEIFRQTSTIGLREISVGKTELERRMRAVAVDGHEVRVKLALEAGRVVNAQPEYDDVVRAATATGRPVKDVLAEAAALSRGLLPSATD